MITLFTSPSCTSCRKAKAWLQDEGLPFEERNIFSNPLTQDEIKQILSLSELGTEGIISTRSKVYEKLTIDIDELPLHEFVKLIEKKPGLLRRPLIMDSKRLQVGYNEENIHQFVPREIRRSEAKEKAISLIFRDLDRGRLI